jgi:hypothetical protein
MQGHKVPNSHLKEKMVTATQMTYACVFLISVLSPVTAYAENTDLKQGAEQAGQTVGSTVHKIGQTGKEVGLGIAHGAVDIGHAAKAGAIEFWKAVKGDTGTTGNTRSQN